MKELDIKELSVEQKIGQLLVVRGCNDEEDKKFIYEMIDKKAVGGVQMCFCDGYKDFMDEIKSRADYPILICADMENGYPGGKIKYPTAMGISSCGDPKIAYELGRITAIEAKKDGVNVAWGPVVDLSGNGAVNKNARCFGDDPKFVSEYANQMIKGFQDEGMIVTAKHFPGCCDVLVDTHMEKGDSNLTEKELLEKDIVPYLEAMKDVELSGIMTGHVLLKSIDDKYIASLSKKVIDIIRNQGFDGLIVTDSLAMMAVVQNYGDEASIGLSVAAGNDMVLPNYRLSFKESFDYLMKAYENKVFSEERLNEAVRRVLKAQKQTMKKASLTEPSKEMIELAENINCKCISETTAEGISFALSDKTTKHFVILCENEYPKDCQKINREIELGNSNSRASAEIRKEKLLKAFENSTATVISEFPNNIEIEETCNMISKADETIFFTFCKTCCYLGTDGITERMEALMKANIDKISTVVHIGNPYEVKKFKNIKRIISSVCDNDDYIIKILKGEKKAEGILPVNI